MCARVLCPRKLRRVRLRGACGVPEPRAQQVPGEAQGLSLRDCNGYAYYPIRGGVGVGGRGAALCVAVCVPLPLSRFLFLRLCVVP